MVFKKYDLAQNRHIKRFQNFFIKTYREKSSKSNIGYFGQIYGLHKIFYSIFNIFLIFLVFVFSKGPKNTLKSAFFLPDRLHLFFFINLNVLLVSLYHVWNEKFLAPMKKKILLTCNFWDSQLQSKMTKMVKKGSWQKGNLPDPPHQELSNFIFSKNITIQGFKTGDRVSCKFLKNFAGLTEFLCFHNS